MPTHRRRTQHQQPNHRYNHDNARNLPRSVIGIHPHHQPYQQTRKVTAANNQWQILCRSPKIGKTKTKRKDRPTLMTSSVSKIDKEIGRVEKENETWERQNKSSNEVSSPSSSIGYEMNTNQPYLQTSSKELPIDEANLHTYEDILAHIAQNSTHEVVQIETEQADDTTRSTHPENYECNIHNVESYGCATTACDTMDDPVLFTTV